MGEVYQPRDGRLGRDVALKVLAAHSLNTRQARERFAREARSVAGLQHPNICAVDVTDADGGGAGRLLDAVGRFCRRGAVHSGVQ